MADSTLNAIRIKIRRLTKKTSPNQISDTDINEYINTFIQYDFPEHLRLFSLKETLTFYTNPNIDTYASNSIVGDPLNNFSNVYTTVNPPVYVAGYEVNFSQSREEFFGAWPFNNFIGSVGTGDGVSTLFFGTLTNRPVLRNNVTFVSIDANNNGLRLSDNGAGSFVGDIGIGPNAIDYETGIFSVTFSNPPGANQSVDAETVPYQAARPTSVLYFNDSFVMRPVPDRVYPVNIEVYRRPTEVLAANQSPELEQWWQYIAFGASLKLLEDNSDYDTMQAIMPRYKEQELLVLRRTIVQQTNERTATIYTDQLGVGPRYNWGQSNF